MNIKNALLSIAIVAMCSGCTAAQGKSWKTGLAITGVVAAGLLAGVGAGLSAGAQNSRNNRQYSVQPNAYSGNYNSQRATVTTTSANTATVRYEGTNYYCYENGNYVTCSGGGERATCYTYGSSVYCR